MSAATSSRRSEDSRPIPITRITKGSVEKNIKPRKLTYCLSVLQQPERARACGSGAKSSADRRPVDPPPVVELRIYEGEGQEKQDITFSYEANFFLFATLEVARPIAHGRVQQPPSPQVPVLTGMPVSGMAYLDRPSEAGYFIFPDLSVRHEGKYRLSFNLYEETKNEWDTDAEPANDSKPNVGAGVPDASFDWRMEVKSDIFVVYSAKKFPGLAESTMLSRTVAEQGCRVRIRRDVRMRRREGKDNAYEETADDEYARVGRAPESHEPYNRERSHSNGSDEGRAPYPEPQRRNSGEFPPHQYHEFTPSPTVPHTAAPQGGHLGWMPGYNQQHSGQQGQFAQPPPPPPPPPSASQPYQSASSAHHQPGPPVTHEYRPAPPPPSHSSYYDRQAPYSAYPTNPPREQREPEYRRASVGTFPPSGPQAGPYPSVDPSFNRPQYHGYPPRPRSPGINTPVNLAPLSLPPIEPKYDNLSSPPGPPLSSVSRIAPPLPSPSYDRSQERTNSYSGYPTSGPLVAAPPPAPVEAPRNGKRPYDSVFPSTASSQSLFNGQRPSSSHNQGPIAEEEEYDTSLMKMSYKRADGSQYMRELPSLE